MNTQNEKLSIASPQPAPQATLQEWVNWYFDSFLSAWIETAKDPAGFGFFDLLDQQAKPLQKDRRTVLAQARLLFTFSHLALLNKNTGFFNAAAVTRDALDAFRKAPGSYSKARTANREITSDSNDNLAYSYDQSFVILALSTWGQVQSEENIISELEACWLSIQNSLTDSLTGLLLEHDGLTNPKDATAPYRAQNPHMHLYEAALQAFEMTKEQIWLERAQQMRLKGLEYFFDKKTGTIVEFIAPNLSTLSGQEGQRREIGHQCEWAWLLYREAELGGDASVCEIADRLLLFADAHGFASSGVMQGAAYDAVSSDTSWNENTFLLWPQTEAIKSFAIRKENTLYANKAQELMLLVFQRYFSSRAAFVNQLDTTGKPIWTEALSRLHYHLVLALTEGARNGLWRIPG